MLNIKTDKIINEKTLININFIETVFENRLIKGCSTYFQLSTDRSNIVSTAVIDNNNGIPSIYIYFKKDIIGQCH